LVAEADSWRINGFSSLVKQKEKVGKKKVGCGGGFMALSCEAKKKGGGNFAVFCFAVKRIFFNFYDVIT